MTLTKNWLETSLLVGTLQMYDMNLLTIEDDAFNTSPFQHLRQLTFINLTIRVLKPGIFNGLHFLSMLSLDSLNIFEFSPNILAPVPNLQMFFMRICGKHVLTLDNLFGNVEMKHLKTVEIIDCNLKNTISKKTFSGLYAIQKLVLKSTRIEEIGPQSFDYVLMTLGLLILDGNQLTSIPKNLFKCNRTSPVTVTMLNNPIHCDCDMDHFRAFTQTTTNIEFSQITCKTPAHYAGTILQQSKPFCIESEKEEQIEEVAKSEPIKLIADSNEIAANSDFSSIATEFIDFGNDSFYEIQTEKSLPNAVAELKIHLKIRCDSSRSRRNSRLRKLTLTQSKLANRLRIRIENGKFIISADFTENQYNLIEFKLSDYATMVNCALQAVFDDSSKKLQVERLFEPNHMYRFCIFQPNSNRINVLDCWNFYKFLKKNQSEVLVEPWIWLEDKGKAISVTVLLMVLAIVFGGAIAVVLKCLFPLLVMPNVEKTIVKQGSKKRSIKLVETE